MIVGTAGHVDHGKSTLVRLLTGTEPDRWEEERRRGLTIGLGYAFATLPDGTPLAMVDVPGHARFVRTMLGGAHAVDVALLVVSATEGWMPQTEEHLAALQLFGTRCGVVALTHVDLVDRPERTAAEHLVRERLVGSFLSGAPIVGVDGSTGAGLDRLRDALGRALRGAPDHVGTTVRSGRPRMWVDRSVVIDGVGRVLTGTLTGGRVAVGDPVQVMRGERTHSSRIRSLHVDGAPAEVACAGQRVAILLSHTDPRIGRGWAVVHADQWMLGSHLHVALEPVRTLAFPAARGGHDVMLGTARWAVQLRRPRRSVAIEGTGGQGSPASPRDLRRPEVVRLHAAQPVGPVAPGDRLVLFDNSVGRCVAGGVVLAVDDRAVRRSAASLGVRLDAIDAASSAAMVGAVLDEHGGVVSEAALRAELGCIDATDRVIVHDGLVLQAGVVRSRADALLAALESSGGQGVALRGDPVEAAAALMLTAHHGTAMFGGRLWHSSADAASWIAATDDHLLRVAGERVWHRVELARAAGVGARELGDRVRSGQLVGLGGDLLASATAQAAWERRVCQELAGAPATLSELRDVLGLSRREALAVLERLDARGVTERIGDRRVLAGSLPADEA